jgi:putative lipoprotein
MANGDVIRAILLSAVAVSFEFCCPVFYLNAQEAPGATPKSHRMPMMQKFAYSCDQGVKVSVFLRERNARVIFQNKTYQMKQTEAASGTRYSNGSIVWWSKGEQGFLEDDTQSDHPVRLADNCKLEMPASAGSALIAGTVAYRERMALPENALLTIELKDVSTAYAAGKVIAEQSVMLAGRQVPIPFELRYDPEKIDPKHRYALSARITINAQLIFLNTTAYPVITHGNPTTAHMLLNMVEGQKKMQKRGHVGQ